MKNNYKIQKSDRQWKKELSDEAYHILREKGTELPFSGKYNLFFKDGVYHCSGCQIDLFDSESKFNAHCGWPSFDRSIKERIIYKEDLSSSMTRTEIICDNCGGHLGHVFDDGPTETKKRYCVNSLSLSFKEKK